MAVSAALSILHRADYIDRFDVPGERVRGTRVLHPKIRPQELDLDWEALREKERRDRAKLKSMIDFVYARMCRQEAILRYFGEPEPERCGNCDICADHAHANRRRGTEDEVLLVRKALSGVARMSQRTAGGWKGRFGRGRIVQALLGSRTRAVLDARLDQLSTYGLLKDEGISYLNELFREMEATGLIVQTRHVGFNGKEYQTVTLTSTGDQVMRGGAECELSWPERQTVKRKTPAPNSLQEEDNYDLDTNLVQALKRKREEIARAEGNVPRYLIFSDETLSLFARLKPRNGEAGRKIKGVGEAKAEKYLPQFLAVIALHEEQTL